ncbi:hypothetical protein QUF80_03435 [Desulfococcaceae bacterium HSG8]|nr:hypothetical protein [Desulfococcaceae bacterium HSG8]
MEDKLNHIENIERYLLEAMILARKKSIRFNDNGLEKLREARESGTAEFPEWFAEDMKNAGAETEQEIS